MRLRFFGRLRDEFGDEVEIELPRDVRDSEQVRNWLGRNHPAVLDPAVKIALDDRMLVSSTLLGDATELSFLPPMSGG